jgi:hypothetical protein
MKNTTLYCLALLITIILIIIFVTSYFQSPIREGLFTNLDPAIISSNVQSGLLSSAGLINLLQHFNQQLSNITIKKININSANLRNNEPMNINEPNNYTTVSLNGRQIGTVASVLNEISRAINYSCLGTKSIDIYYNEKN